MKRWCNYLMNKRDRQIIADLERFRVMSRNDIADLYFNHLKNPANSTNAVLKRLVRDNQIKVDMSFRPYVYLPYNSTIKKQSTKIPHFLNIVMIYKQIKQYYDPDIFLVEPKYKKGLAEPDVFTKLKGVPFFIEVQRNHYSQKVMNDKIKRYEALSYELGYNPFVIMISDTRYEINSDIVTVFQVASIHEFMNKLNKMSPKKEKSTPDYSIKKDHGIKFKIV